MSVVKLKKTHTEKQLEDISGFSADDPTFHLIAVMLFNDAEGVQQIGFSMPEGVTYLTILGALRTAEDWVLSEMTGEVEMIH